MGIRRVIAALALAPALYLLGLGASFGAVLSIVVEQGDPAPGLPDGVVFGRVGQPVIGAQGHIAFEGTLTGGGVTVDDNQSIWTGKPGGLQILAREGDPAPGTEPGVVFDSGFVDNPTEDKLVTRSGQVVFRARVRGPGVTGANNLGYWIGTPGDLRLIVRTGDEAPGLPGAVFQSIPRTVPQCTDAGCVLVMTDSSSLNPAVWAGPPGALELVLRARDPAPGFSPGTTINSFPFSRPVINEMGDIAIPVRVLTTFFGTIVDAVYFGRPGALDVFVKNGDTFPDLGLGETIRAPAKVNINNAGQLTFFATIGPGPNLGDKTVWTGTSDDLRLITRKGDLVPDAAPGAVFNDFIRDPVINGKGDTLFLGIQNPPGGTTGGLGLFTGPVGSTRMLASIVSGVPGFPSISVSAISGRAINAQGDVAFFTGGSPNAWWFGKPGEVDLVAAEGMSFDAGATGLRTIQRIISVEPVAGAGNEDGSRSVLSDDGQVVVWVLLDPGRAAILITELPPPPANALPVVDAFDLAPANEGAVVNVGVGFSDADLADTHVATVDWGDGSPADPFDPAFSPVVGTHVYADNGSFTVTVTVTDSAGASASNNATVAIGNVAPTVAAGADQSITLGETLHLDPATFNDPGTADTHLATIDWGDSTIDVVSATEAPFGPPGGVAGLDGSVAASHGYGAAGDFTVKVTVTDDDSGAGMDTLMVHVADLAPPAPLQCDIDGDRDVDRFDIRRILAVRNTPALGPDDPRDIDGDGRITVLDARKCVRLCTRARCATN